MLLRVVPDRIDYPASADQRRLIEQAQQDLGELRDRLFEQGADVGCSVLMSGDPASKILSFARRYRPSLIAMSTHGRTGLKRWTRGSVAERVLRSSPFPLLLWNPFQPSGIGRGGGARFQKILVPFDGSETSAEILPLVREFALLNDARVVLFHAQTLYPTAGDYAGIILPPSPKEMVKMFKPFLRRLRGVRTSVRIVIGIPAEAVLEAARKEEADLIAMTTHGRSGLSRWAFGSVAEQILRHCPLPLLVQRTGGAA